MPLDHLSSYPWKEDSYTKSDLLSYGLLSANDLTEIDLTDGEFHVFWVDYIKKMKNKTRKWLQICKEYVEKEIFKQGIHVRKYLENNNHDCDFHFDFRSDLILSLHKYKKPLQTNHTTLITSAKKKKIINTLGIDELLSSGTPLYLSLDHVVEYGFLTSNDVRSSEFYADEFTHIREKYILPQLNNKPKQKKSVLYCMKYVAENVSESWMGLSRYLIKNGCTWTFQRSFRQVILSAIQRYRIRK